MVVTICKAEKGRANWSLSVFHETSHSVKKTLISIHAFSSIEMLTQNKLRQSCLFSLLYPFTVTIPFRYSSKTPTLQCGLKNIIETSHENFLNNFIDCEIVLRVRLISKDILCNPIILSSYLHIMSWTLWDWYIYTYLQPNKKIRSTYTPPRLNNSQQEATYPWRLAFRYYHSISASSGVVVVNVLLLFLALSQLAGGPDCEGCGINALFLSASFTWMEWKTILPLCDGVFICKLIGPSNPVSEQEVPTYLCAWIWLIYLNWLWRQSIPDNKLNML